MYLCKKCSTYQYDWEFKGQCVRCNSGIEFMEYGNMKRDREGSDYYWEEEEQPPDSWWKKLV